MLDDLDEDVEPAEVWGLLWEDSELPMKEIEAYLSKWHDRFNLFDPVRPFMQVPDLRTSRNELTQVSKIISDVPDGDRLFSLRSGQKLNHLTFAEAARWLIHVQAFDTAGIKSGVVGDLTVKGGKSYPRGTGWAGNLGGVFLEGETLRETLLLNFVVWEDDDNETFSPDDLPTWEQSLRTFGSLDTLPVGRADIYTWQSRRVRLVADQGVVVGLVLTNGDKLESKNMHRIESMTAWRRSKNQEKKLGKVPIYLPMSHRSNRALWRGLNSLFAPENRADGPAANFAPGVLAWAEYLTGANGGRRLSQSIPLHVHGTGLEYGTQSSTVIDLIDDTVLLSSFLLSPEGSPLVVLACDCVGNTDKAVAALGNLMSNLLVAAGGDQDNTSDAANRAKAEAYFELDSLFRRWLASLDADSDVVGERARWNCTARKALDSLAKRCISEVGPRGITGALLLGRRGKPSTWITSSIAERWFYSAIRGALPLEEDAIVKEGSGSEKRGD